MYKDKGIEVTLRENESEEIARINGDDLLVIVNSLKMSGAEAISINDQRIINMSDIVDINETFIKSKWAKNISSICYKSNWKFILFRDCINRKWRTCR